MRTDQPSQQDFSAQQQGESFVQAARADGRVNGHAKGWPGRADGGNPDAAAQVLEWTSSQPDGAVRVLLEDGWVTPSGAVDWQQLGQNTDEDSRLLSGMISVRDRIVIRPCIAVKADIEVALRRSAVVDAKAIAVTVNGAEVTLAGTVRNPAEREAAIKSVLASAGVQKVIDKMTLPGRAGEPGGAQTAP